ncbi:MAG: NAD(P)/FAD-dependent oxidoreductase, partial [Acidimicrobiaceae bacterium]|nr:NAD(P)/FAD-dependent oxidoreductase [Acidimicrobiaceae bacterium]
MADTDIWDVVVVGAGPPGENVAQFATLGSDRTAVLVEDALVGGECSFWACMPSKGLLRPIEVVDDAKHLPGVVGARVDVDAVLARRDAIVNHHDDGSQVKWATDHGIDVVRGRGRLAGVRQVDVTTPEGTTRRLQARHAVVLATGTTALVPPVPGLREALPWISRDVTNLHEIPRRVLIVGGGVVACESATWLVGLGAEEVTIVERSETLLGRTEPFAARMVADAFERAGVRVLLGASVSSVSRTGAEATGEGHIHGGEAQVTVGKEVFAVDEIVVAAGRVPNSADLGAETVGTTFDRYVEVDDHLGVRGVAGDWLYAIGDLNGRALLTHMGKYQARIAGAVIGARADGRPLAGSEYLDSADHGQVPQVTFTDPQVASVGLTEAAARAAGIRVA